MFRALSVFILVATLTGTIQAEEELYLRYALPNAKELLYEVKASSSIKTLGAKLRQEWKSREKIEPLGDGSQRISVTLEDMFESEPASGGIMQRDIINQLVDDVVSFKSTERGHVSDFALLGVDRYPIRERKTKRVILVQLRHLYQAALPQLPAGPAEDGWEVTDNLKVTDGTVEVNDTFASKFEIKKTKKKDGRLCVEVKEKTQVELDSYMCFGQGRENRLLTFRTIGTGVREGSFLFDTERGIILEYKGEAKLKIKYGPIGQPASAMQETDARIKFQRKLKSIKDL